MYLDLLPYPYEVQYNLGGHPNYIAPHTGMAVNPNTISEQNFKFYIPLNPSLSSTVSSTPLGPIGVSISGVPFFNQYAGPNNQPLAVDYLVQHID